jgi:hypothetical protein
LHILIDFSTLSNDDIYKELFNARKVTYNDSHDITIHNIPIELYVQDSNEPVISLGEYSILDDQWLRIPTKRRANFDQTATKVKYDKLLHLIEIGLKSKDIDKISELLKTIKRYRQAGLDKGGEFGPENLAYKVLRKQGYIDKLYQLRDKLHSQKLSIEEDPNYYTKLKKAELEEEKEELPSKVYHVTPARNVQSIMMNGLMPQVGDRSNKIQGETPAVYCFPDTNSLEDAMMNWLGDEFGEDEDLALLEISTSGLEGDVTPNAEYEIQIFDPVPPQNIKVLSQNLATMVLEASGYIPSEKEKNDPRFKTALTVDIKPDTMKKNAKKFGNQISRAGIPPTLRANGKF